MKHKTLQQYTDRIMKLVRDMADDAVIKDELERVLKDAYTHGYNNRVTNETRWP